MALKGPVWDVFSAMKVDIWPQKSKFNVKVWPSENGNLIIFGAKNPFSGLFQSSFGVVQKSFKDYIGP